MRTLNVGCAVGILLATCGAAVAQQSEAETFRRLGEQLQQIQTEIETYARQQGAITSGATIGTGAAGSTTTVITGTGTTSTMGTSTGQVTKFSVDGSTAAGNLFDRLTARAKDLRDQFADNPYVSVKGFQVTLGLPPSVNVQFEFREGMPGSAAAKPNPSPPPK